MRIIVNIGRENDSPFFAINFWGSRCTLTSRHGVLLSLGINDWLEVIHATQGDDGNVGILPIGHSNFTSIPRFISLPERLKIQVIRSNARDSLPAISWYGIARYAISRCAPSDKYDNSVARKGVLVNFDIDFVETLF